MLPFKKYNKGYSYIMVAIDVFSRYAFAEAIKSKEGKSVTKAFKDYDKGEVSIICANRQR